MAADSAKKTVTSIASDSGSKVVKAISKDLADDAKEEQAKDDATKAEKKEAEEGKDGEAATPVASDPKAPTVEKAKDEPNRIVFNPPDAESSPTDDTATKEKTIAIEVAQNSSKPIQHGYKAPSESKTDTPPAAPVSLKIALGADGEIKAVTKGSTDPAPAVESTTSKTTSVLTATKTAIVASDPPKEKEEAPETTTSSPEPAQNSEKKSATVHGSPQSIEKIPIEQEESEAQTSKPVPQPASTAEEKSEPVQPASQVITKAPSPSSPAIVTAVATITSTSKTISKAALEESNSATEGPKMVTVSQESLDLLHQKIDIMHEAIQHITKVLALHLPASATDLSEASGPNPIKNIEAIIDEALSTAVRPLTGLLPEIASKSDGSSHPPLVDPLSPKPERPTAEKRTSVLGSIGKVFWPFGSAEKVATVTVTEVTAHQATV